LSIQTAGNIRGHMNSIAIDDLHVVMEASLPLPVMSGSIRAGFQFPADDFSVKRQDLNERLIPTLALAYKIDRSTMPITRSRIARLVTILI
jgi:hypothetical protein